MIDTITHWMAGLAVCAVCLLMICACLTGAALFVRFLIWGDK